MVHVRIMGLSAGERILTIS